MTIPKRTKFVKIYELIIYVNTKCGYYIAEETVVYAVSLESVLSGHENWIYSVKWQPPVNSGINSKIFSSSDLKGHT